MIRKLIFLFLCLISHLFSEEEEVCVHLRNPTLVQGILHTDEGGVVTASGFRLQAQEITYTRKKDLSCIEAKGDLFVTVNDTILVGDRIVYDFNTKEGILENGRTALPPWFFGGKIIRLCNDGSFQIDHAYVTTSENSCPEWHIAAESLSLGKCGSLSAKNLQFKIDRFPLFWLPRLNTHLDTIFDNPIRYKARIGGHQGPRIGMLYEFISWNRFKANLRFDYRFTRGPGGGIETHYTAPERKVVWDTINYIARDSTLTNPSEQFRFRFQGIYSKTFSNDKTSLYLSYDKLSDRYMASDYKDKGLELDTAEKTQLLIRHQEPYWIGSFFSHVRINSFQTVKQELPTLEGRWKPYTLGKTGIIGETLASSSYLDYEYAKSIRHVNEYKSVRLSLRQSFYRAFKWRFATLTPEVLGLGVYYSNSPERQYKWVVQGVGGATLETTFFATHGNLKHTIHPYASYYFYSFPLTSPDEHYIFDIDDGIYQLQIAKLGVSQNLVQKSDCFFPTRILSWDLYTYLFSPNRSIEIAVPKIYSDITWFPRNTLKSIWSFGVDIQNQKIDHCNLRLDWTVSKDLACSIEYRQRSAYSWRKADPTNFFLDAFRTENALEHSALSDRRNTLLTHLYYRLTPTVALEMASRQGWNRKYEPKYLEFEIDFHATLRSCWKTKIAYQHKENDDRIALYLSLGLKKPDSSESECAARLLEF